jgi:DNA-binding NtrC family response regulator
VLLDYRLPDIDGLEILRRIRGGKDPDLGVILVTAFGTMESAIEALRLGAQDYVIKPMPPEQLLSTVERALEATQIQRSLRRAQEKQVGSRRFAYLVGESPAMLELLDLIARVAAISQARVLLLGETGTGKSLVARALHESSPRADRSFAQINCATLPESLVEVELFGAEAGAFTDAREPRPGLIEQAIGGTLFLDEIGAMPLSLQPKLLHFLESGTYRRVGGTREFQADVRIIAATNRDLEQAMKEGEFRADLYFRLQVLPIYIPPLRERGDDIILLAHHFLHRFSQEFGKKIHSLDADAEAILRRYPWPGNVRELRNIIERAVLLTQGTILSPRDLVGLKPEAAPEEDVLSLDEVEKRQIFRVLERTDGNKTEAARLLGISRETLRKKLQSFGIHGG